MIAQCAQVLAAKHSPCPQLHGQVSEALRLEVLPLELYLVGREPDIVRCVAGTPVIVKRYRAALAPRWGGCRLSTAGAVYFLRGVVPVMLSLKVSAVTGKTQRAINAKPPSADPVGSPRTPFGPSRSRQRVAVGAGRDWQRGQTAVAHDCAARTVRRTRTMRALGSDNASASGERCRSNQHRANPNASRTSPCSRAEPPASRRNCG